MPELPHFTPRGPLGYIEEAIVAIALKEGRLWVSRGRSVTAAASLATPGAWSHLRPHVLRQLAGDVVVPDGWREIEAGLVELLPAPPPRMRPWPVIAAIGFGLAVWAAVLFGVYLAH